jgi:hypothetical protein
MQWMSLIGATLLCCLLGAAANYALPSNVPTTAVQAGSSAESSESSVEQSVERTRTAALPTITTNFSANPQKAIRIEAVALVDADGGPTDQDIHQMVDGLVAFIRTEDVSLLETAAGYQGFVDELSYRAHALTGGQIHRLLISTFLVE